jgi:transcriptional regulator with XRE-family HTH domain
MGLMAMNNLKELREQANLTQKAVAEALGTTQQTYQRWEKGVSRPPIDALQSLAILLKVPLKAILGTPDGTSMGFDAHNHIITGDETGFWGHIGLQFAGEVTSRWYPISARESMRVSAVLSSCDDPDAVLSLSTLNNRVLVFKPAALSRIWLLDEACDEPDGETHFTDPPHPELDDTNGLPSSFYRAVIAGRQCDDDEMERLGPTLMAHADALLAKAGLSEGELFEMFEATKFHMIGGTVLLIQPREVDLCEMLSDFEADATSLFLAFDDVRDEAEQFIPRRNILLIDAPRTAFEDGQEEILSGMDAIP